MDGYLRLRPLVGAQLALFYAGRYPLAHSLPRGELLLVPEAGHFAGLERPEVLRQALRRFLASL